jgi:ATPase subunit of ABC transporter with duplicated ATPase domains
VFAAIVLKATIYEKQLGSKVLFRELSFMVHEGSKTGLIGRNGVGKSTLFRMLTGEDMDFTGTVERKPDIRIVATAQEHFAVDELTPVDYVLASVPDYHELKHILDSYPDTMGEDEALIHEYTEAVQTFSERDYYDIEDGIVASLARFQIDLDMAFRPLKELSGGQKRFVELVRVAFARADLILLDEPTNHLDYHGKALFINWLAGLETAACIISHDRDVLEQVDKIVEIRDYHAFTYPGNYERYIKQNGIQTVTAVEQYESARKRLVTLHAQIQTANARKAGAADSKPRILADRLQREYDALEDSLEKPSFWIDRETSASLSKESSEQYEKYKARGIKLDMGTEDRHSGKLLQVSKLEVGYDHSLFPPVSFTLEHKDRLMLRGRNGAGKSTLVRAIMAATSEATFGGTIFGGTIEGSAKLRIGSYEQEVAASYLPLPLGEAIVTAYLKAGLVLTDQALRAVLSRYLFDPIRDKNLAIQHLSGGQKARFQLIQLFATNPNLLVLDEPTNHLDLPSIEELEDALLQYHGAVIYVSHDSHFIHRIGGTILQVGHL